MKVCRDLSLQATLSIVYRERYGDGNCIVSDTLIDADSEVEESVYFQLRQDGANVCLLSPANFDSYDKDDLPRCIKVKWATPMKPVGVGEEHTNYLAYGNDASIGTVYSTLCLLVEL